MYKLIVIDIDGTLLNSYGEVTKENKEAIKRAMNKNINVVLTSGRIPNAIIPIANEINANKYIISGNGASIYDIEKDEIIYKNYLSKEKVLNIIDVCEKNSMFYNVCTSNFILTKSLNYSVLFYHNENKRKTKDKRIKINIVNDVYKYIKNYSEEDFLKITVCDNDKSIFNNIINKFRTFDNIDILEVSHNSKKIIKQGTKEYMISYFYIEITNKNVNKWTAIEKLIDKLNITKDEVLAIGDNINDKEMVKNAGLGIVTGNSSPYMKKIADEIVATNNESGVAEAIEKHIG